MTSPASHSAPLTLFFPSQPQLTSAKCIFLLKNLLRGFYWVNPRFLNEADLPPQFYAWTRSPLLVLAVAGAVSSGPPAGSPTRTPLNLLHSFTHFPAPKGDLSVWPVSTGKPAVCQDPGTVGMPQSMMETQPLLHRSLRLCQVQIRQEHAMCAHKVWWGQQPQTPNFQWRRTHLCRHMDIFQGGCGECPN